MNIADRDHKKNVVADSNLPVQCEKLSRDFSILTQNRSNRPLPIRSILATPSYSDKFFRQKKTMEPVFQNR